VPEDFGEKTEQPTDHRRQESRQRGQVAKSMDLNAAVILLGGILALYALGGGILGTLHGSVRRLLGPEEMWVRADADTIHGKVVGEVSRTAEVMLPFLGVMAVLAIAVNVLQVGFIFTGHPLMPKLSKISPLKGLARIFSKRGLAKLLTSLAKVAAIGAVGAWVIAGELGTLMHLTEWGFGGIAMYGIRTILSLGVKLGLVLIVLGALDYAFQRWQHEQELKMTKQELKDEMSRMEGNPLVRERRRAIARRIAYARMAQQVPQSDVVVTNPTHLAVALKYAAEAMDAPLVVAKGAGHMAARIREIAAMNGVPIVEKKPLAQALYRDVEVGQPVPPHLYRAVAEVLAYVYELSKKTVRPRVAV